MSEKLLKIDRKNWIKLRDLYSPNDPKTLLGHCVVENYIQWFEKNPNCQNIVFYCLNGDWSDGTFVAIVRTKNVDREIRFHINYNTLYLCTHEILGSSVCICTHLGTIDGTLVSVVGTH